MSHSEFHADGSSIRKIVNAESSQELAKRMGQLSLQAFTRGAIRVEQKRMHNNEDCLCGSGLRFDLCCKKTMVRA